MGLNITYDQNTLYAAPAGIFVARRVWRVTIMQDKVRLMIASIAAMALVYLTGIATAQSVKQITLTEKQIEGFIAAQNDMSAIAAKIEDASDRPDPKLQTELEGIVRKHGFDSLAEYDDVAASISAVMVGIDPESKQFTEPKMAIQKEIDDVKADASIPEIEKKQRLDELVGALEAAQPNEDPSNIAIVKRYYDRVDAVMR